MTINELKQLVENLKANNIPTSIATVENENPYTLLDKINIVIANLEEILELIEDLNTNKLNASKQAVSDVGGLVTPTVAPTSDKLVGIDNTGAQEQIDIGTGLSVVDGNLISTGEERTFEMTGTFNEIRDKVFELSPKYIDIKVSKNIYATLTRCTITANEDGSLSNITFNTENIPVLNNLFTVRFYREIGGDSLGGVVTKRYTVTWDDRLSSKHITATLYLSKAGTGITQIDYTINNKIDASKKTLICYSTGSKDIGDKGSVTAILYY